MNNDLNETFNQLILTIESQSYDELIDSFKINLYRFKYDMGGTIKSIDPDKFWESGSTLRDLQARIELLLKLSDFIDYVGSLQGVLIKK